MSPLLIFHICAGATAIISGAAAVTARKGELLHRGSGTMFVLSMLVMSMLGVYLAFFGPQPTGGAAPPKASAAVGLLTFYLVLTAWLSARRATAKIGWIDYGLMVFALGVMIALLTFGVEAHASAPGKPGGYAPYFVFAGFAASLSALDLKVILRGGISGAARIARHLWRMCFALFFATAFFFIGQQKVMPAFLHGSPFLVVLAIAPLALMIVWLARVRFNKTRIPSAVELGSG